MSTLREHTSSVLAFSLAHHHALHGVVTAGSSVRHHADVSHDSWQALLSAQNDFFENSPWAPELLLAAWLGVSLSGNPGEVGRVDVEPLLEGCLRGDRVTGRRRGGEREGEFILDSGPSLSVLDHWETLIPSAPPLPKGSTESI